ncbi:hypothetical protein TNIN_290531 [Trichonephila inaurata madagascariensis]|uniref:Uncharacterized protein n=1 Tax=Trichonephila inaurata madagascariensis TaxID=2747483 RepID=A0A8X6WW89_9ARAC|nr:hypothetical protein TNIN_290531 [Trichonephila inaurata madagascariensis]
MAFEEKVPFLCLWTLKMHSIEFGELDCLKSWFPVVFLATCVNGLRVFLTKDLLVLGIAILNLALSKPDRDLSQGAALSPFFFNPMINGLIELIPKSVPGVNISFFGDECYRI